MLCRVPPEALTRCIEKKLTVGKRDRAASAAELHLIFSAFSELKGYGEDKRMRENLLLFKHMKQHLVEKMGRAKCQISLPISLQQTGVKKREKGAKKVLLSV